MSLLTMRVARLATAGLCLAAGTATSLAAQDAVADTLTRMAQNQPKPAPQPAPAPEATKDPREGDEAYEQAKRLYKAIDAILQDAATQRADAKKLPSKEEFIIRPPWTETREDRQSRINDLLSAVLGIVTDVPVVDVQKRIEKHRANIREIEGLIAQLREKRVAAPKDAGLIQGMFTDTVESIDRKVADQKARIADNRAEIAKAKTEVQEGLAKSGVKMSADQLDLMLDSVLSGDLVRLVAAFNAAKGIDQQLGQLVQQNGENLASARKYFAMHAALFAMLVHGQDNLIEKIDTGYLPKLGAIEKDIKAASDQTRELLRNPANRPDQKKALEANLASQKTASQAAQYYRQYLLRQRELLAAARAKAAHDLRIADNTYQTVEASFQLRQLMKDSATSFEAIQKLEAPGFDQIFQNEELRREFENLTRKLGAPTS